MRIALHGVRGSTPVSGPDFQRYGGHSSCVAIASDDRALPTLVLDAGTGLLRLAREFGPDPFRGTILCTHLHWDHVQGLPFFFAADRDDAEVTFVQPAQGDPLATMARAMSPPHFPITPDGLRGAWKYASVEPGTHDFGGFSVTAREVPHKGGRAFGYRIERDGRSFTYVPDAVDDSDDAVIPLAQGADVLLRGAPYVASESERARDFGHGTIEHTIGVARRAGVGRLIVTHHGPTRTDDALDEIAASRGVELAVEGLVIEL